MTLGVFVWALRERDLAIARNLAFTVLVFGELFRSFASRSTTRVFWQVGAFSNVVLVAVVTVSVVLQLLIQHLAVMEVLFDVGTPTSIEYTLCVVLGLVPVTTIEIAKLLRQRRAR